MKYLLLAYLTLIVVMGLAIAVIAIAVFRGWKDIGT